MKIYDDDENGDKTQISAQNLKSPKWENIFSLKKAPEPSSPETRRKQGFFGSSSPKYQKPKKQAK